MKNFFKKIWKLLKVVTGIVVMGILLLIEFITKKLKRIAPV